MQGLNMVLFEPEATWKHPKFPNLSSAKKISIDVETKDPLLTTKGSGVIRKDGYPVGISLASDTGFKGYFPIEHFAGGNMDKEQVINFFKDLLARPDLMIVGAHLQYDLEWLKFLGIGAKGGFWDIQLAEPLIDEEQKSYSLDALAKKYLGISKSETLLDEAAAAYGVHPKNDLWKLHAKYVGKYAEDDAMLPLQIMEHQWKEMKKQNLFLIYDLEWQLIPILLEMRFKGVRVDLEKADKYSKEWKIKEEKLRMSLKKEIGYDIDVFSPQALERYCSLKGIEHPRTEKGNASFDKIFLTQSENPFFNKIREIRSINRLRKTYVDELIFGNEINGRLHCEFTQMRRDEGGTRTGRFASKNPNLQQVPSRDKVLAPIIRSLFLPETKELWAKLDYSQQEPRILTHYGFITKLRGADKVRNAYLRDKQTDFYTLVSKESGLERKPAKDLTLGICYAEGKDKIAHDLGVSVDEAMRLKDVFNAANPFIKELSDMAMNRAQKVGYITTILGRRRHFDFWEPDRNSGQYGVFIKGLQQAQETYPKVKLQRAFAYKALNALIQGSSADMTKQAMVIIYKELGKIPMLTVHDELDYSVTDSFEATSLQYRMENCIEELTVPMWAELSLGKHWK